MERQKIKKLNDYVREVEILEDLIQNGFLQKDNSNPNIRNIFESAGNFHHGCAVEGSVNQRMFEVEQTALKVYELIMQDEARKIIKELEAKIRN
jgi:hypothetical protein